MNALAQPSARVLTAVLGQKVTDDFGKEPIDLDGQRMIQMFGKTLKASTNNNLFNLMLPSTMTTAATANPTTSTTEMRGGSPFVSATF